MRARCPSCNTEIPEDHHFCGSCGAPVSAPSQLPTQAEPSRAPVRAETPAARILWSDTKGGGGFTPGTMLAGRYRLIGLLGRGGMGEVYRADDLKLGQPVALKFLPNAFAEDPARRERFVAEVRIARQIAHPNVCRVYDIGEAERRHFLSMEYVDGEDLASLLRRIGRLPSDKALDIARQVAAGMAAAHQGGVLHRDLKPANVMLDGRGRVRITDFGLAVAADSAAEADDSGTPAYMAPEQLAGKGASARSDVYALGLLMYELYTGKRPFAASTLDELRARKQQQVVPPSHVIRDMDPAVERVILRALSPEPAARPASAAEVAKALPGGSALEAALRAGETPSPEMVAESGSHEGLEPPVAWALLALVLAGSIAAIGLGSRVTLWRRAALDQAPEVLAEKARAIQARLGYTERAADRASGFQADLEYLRHLRNHDRSRSRWNRSDPGFFRFWLRESPEALTSTTFAFRYGNFSRVDAEDPPLDLAGMTLVQLDPSGRLVHFVAVPPSVRDASATATPPDWDALLTAGGFAPPAFKPVAPISVPPFYGDARGAWEGAWPTRPDIPVRLEAAALGGKPIYFEVVFPWSRPARVPTSALSAAERAVLVVIFLGVGALIVAAALLARHNVRAGRGDRQGAFRVAAFVLAAMLVSWFFAESHVAGLREVPLVLMALGWALVTAGSCWLFYLAAEPAIRRRWPRPLVGWARLLSGEVRDPLVGRDVLIGCAAGTAFTILEFTSVLQWEWLGFPPEIVPADLIGVTYGLQRTVPLLVWRLAQSVIVGLASLFVLLLLRMALGSGRIAVAVFVAGGAAMSALANESFWLAIPIAAAMTGAFAFVLARVGLLGVVTAFYVSGLFIVFPITADLQAWYAGAGMMAVGALVALAVFGFTAALGGRPALGNPRSFDALRKDA
jgi:tRNA A-37 threonylcarbamoyl transferase component Bud32